MSQRISQCIGGLILDFKDEMVTAVTARFSTGNKILFLYHLYTRYFPDHIHQVIHIIEKTADNTDAYGVVNCAECGLRCFRKPLTSALIAHTFFPFNSVIDMFKCRLSGRCLLFSTLIFQIIHQPVHNLFQHRLPGCIY